MRGKQTVLEGFPARYPWIYHGVCRVGVVQGTTQRLGGCGAQADTGMLLGACVCARARGTYAASHSGMSACLAARLQVHASLHARRFPPHPVRALAHHAGDVMAVPYRTLPPVRQLLTPFQNRRGFLFIYRIRIIQVYHCWRAACCLLPVLCRLAAQLMTVSLENNR